MLPDYWLRFLESTGLFPGSEVTIPAADDLSGVGAVIEILSDESSREEAEEFYPGLAVARDGFVPVGNCAIGCGDPYFISMHDGLGGPLYRIYHDQVSDEGYDREIAVAVVLNDFRDVAKYKSD